MQFFSVAETINRKLIRSRPPKRSGGRIRDTVFMIRCLMIFALLVIGIGQPFTVNAAPQGTGKPVALVADSYGKHDVTSIIRTIFDYEDWHFENRGTFLPADEFSKYSLVIVSHAQSAPYSAEDHRRIEAYLNEGGRILLIGSAPKSMYEKETQRDARAWIGFDIRRTRPEEAGAATLASDPLLEGVPVTPPPSWITEPLVATRLEGDATVLVGTPDSALIAKRNVGKGAVYFMGSQPFRLRAAKSPHQKDSASYIRVVRNIIAEAKPLTLTEWRNRLASEWKKKNRRFLMWNREWQRGTEGGPIFVPPLPLQEELIDRLKVDLAVGEYEAIQLNVTDLAKGGKLTWKVHGLPAEAMTVFVQDRPDPIPWPKAPELAKESPFWLMPATAVAPKGEEAVMIGEQETRIFWLKWSTHRLAPGAYNGAIEFFVDGKSLGKVALEGQVYPVRVPKRRAITLHPAGHAYGDVNNVAPAIRFKKNLEDLGFEWTLINIFRLSTLRIEDGSPLDVRWLKANLGAIQSSNPPKINFAAMEPYIDASLEHNLTYFRTTGSVSGAIDGLSKSAKLSEEDARAVRRWFLREVANFLKDKGIRKYFVGMGDELNMDELNHRFIPWARDAAEGGWLTTSSFTAGSVKDLELTRALAPYVGAWTMNRGFIEKLAGWVKSGEVKLADGALLGTYGAGEGRGTEIRKNASASRMIGWEAWAFGLDYCSPNPYFKGWLYYTRFGDRGAGAGERFVAYLDKENLDAPLVNSPFIEGIRESLEEGNLAWGMSWYLKALGDKAPASLHEQAGKIVGDDENAIMRWTESSRADAGVTLSRKERESYIEAKRTVLQILDELRKVAAEAGLKPNVYWHNIPLTENGKPVATILGDYDTSALQKIAKELGGAELPRHQGEKGGVLLLVGTPEDAHVASFVKEQRPSLFGYWIRDWKDGDQTIIWIGGKDPQHVAKAMRNFLYFVKAPTAIFLN